MGARATLWMAVWVSLGPFGCTRSEPPPPPPPTPAKLEQDLLDLAFRDCFLADCERAFAHLSELPAASPLRQSDAFRAIRYRYDADRLLRADTETDAQKKRDLLKAIADSALTDSFLRGMATERIGKLGASPGAAQEVAVNSNIDALLAEETAELMKKSKSKKLADQADVRSKIEPKIFAGKATADDVTMLRNVCKTQKDSACLKRLDHLLLR